MEEGHAIAHKLKDTLMRQFPDIADILIHVEPFPPVEYFLHLQDEDIAATMRRPQANSCRCLLQNYSGRASRYFPVYLQGAPVPASVPSQVICSKEGEILLGQLDTSDQLWLLDEQATPFATSIICRLPGSKQQRMSNTWFFAIGGATDSSGSAQPEQREYQVK